MSEKESLEIVNGLGRSPVFSSHVSDVEFVDKSKRAYLASPFFNPEQIDRLKRVRIAIESIGLKVWDAYTNGIICKPDADKDMLKLAVDNNIDNIDRVGVMVVITDGKDMGSIFEAGYACAKDIPVYGFAETLGDRPFNVMLAGTFVGVAKTTGGLIEALQGKEVRSYDKVE